MKEYLFMEINSFILISVVHGYINRNYVVVAFAWLQAAGSGFRNINPALSFQIKVVEKYWKELMFSINCSCHNTNQPH
jgi:hypothetical protein